MIRLISLAFLAFNILTFPAAAEEEFDPLLPDSPAHFERSAPALHQTNDAIDIDGEFLPPPPPPKTEADKLRQEREALQKKNEEMLKARIEDMRLQNEIEIGKKMDRLLDQGLPPPPPPAPPAK